MIELSKSGQLGSFEPLAVELRQIHRKLDLIIDSIGFRLPYAQKGEEDYGSEESKGSGIQGSSESKT